MKKITTAATPPTPTSTPIVIPATSPFDKPLQYVNLKIEIK
jgi:hypothetical protein